MSKSSKRRYEVEVIKTASIPVVVSVLATSDEEAIVAAEKIAEEKDDDGCWDDEIVTDADFTAQYMVQGERRKDIPETQRRKAWAAYHLKHSNPSPEQRLRHEKLLRRKKRPLRQEKRQPVNAVSQLELPEPVDAGGEAR